MSLKSVSFIINPISGHGDGLAAKTKIEKAVDTDKYEVRFLYTQYAGHASELAAAEVAKGTDIVVAVGGDGTVNEVASELVGSATALAIIPRGSGNGLAFHLGIPHDVVKAVGTLNNGRIKTIDTATFDAHPFFCTAGVGYDAKVAMDYALDGKRGLITYASHALSDWRKYIPQHYVLATEDTVLEIDALLVTVGNANQWGNNFHITPGAKIDDGLLNITIVHPINTLQALPLLPRLIRYSVTDDIHVTSLSAKQVTIHRDGSLEAHYDGEPVMAGRDITIECVPSSLKVVCNL